MKDIKLTEYSHGAGCGCKISPEILESILKTTDEIKTYDKLLVGNASKDDAAAFDLGNGTSALSTTDFFMPIVDDPFTFGKIAATNAISDIHAIVEKESVPEFLEITAKAGLDLQSIGETRASTEKLIKVI